MTSRGNSLFKVVQLWRLTLVLYKVLHVRRYKIIRGFSLLWSSYNCESKGFLTIYLLDKINRIYIKHEKLYFLFFLFKFLFILLYTVHPYHRLPSSHSSQSPSLPPSSRDLHVPSEKSSPQMNNSEYGITRCNKTRNTLISQFEEATQ